MTKAGWIAATLFMASAIGIQAHAADVKIGVIYPLTGNAASAGQSPKTRSNSAPKSSTARIPNLKACRSARPPGCPISAAPRSNCQRRSSGQSAGRAEPDAAPDHAGQGRRDARLVSLLRVAGGDGGRRAAGHSVSRRRFGRAQHHQPRLQMDVPRRARSRRILPRPIPNSSPT